MPSGIFGNELRNRLSGPGFQSFDMSLQRLLKFSSRYGDVTVGRVQPVQHDQLRPAEPQPLGRGDVGTITSLAGDARSCSWRRG